MHAIMYSCAAPQGLSPALTDAPGPRKHGESACDATGVGTKSGGDKRPQKCHPVQLFRLAPSRRCSFDTRSILVRKYAPPIEQSYP